MLEELLPPSARGCATELIADTLARAIVAAARSHEAGEIVVGSRGFGRLYGALGSVSKELLHVSDRPVVIVPAADGRADAGKTL